MDGVCLVGGHSIEVSLLISEYGTGGPVDFHDSWGQWGAAGIGRVPACQLSQGSYLGLVFCLVMTLSGRTPSELPTESSLTSRSICTQPLTTTLRHLHHSVSTLPPVTTFPGAPSKLTATPTRHSI